MFAKCQTYFWLPPTDASLKESRQNLTLSKYNTPFFSNIYFRILSLLELNARKKYPNPLQLPDPCSFIAFHELMMARCNVLFFIPQQIIKLLLHNPLNFINWFKTFVWRMEPIYVIITEFIELQNPTWQKPCKDPL